MENGKARKSKKDKPARALLEPVSDDGSSSFARALGSVDFQTREKGLQALTVYLSRSSQLSALAMRKLWKGIFYCFWHSDKAPTQEALATRLAAIMPQLTDEVALLYFTAFLETMQREWFGIDRLRLDKFLMMVRRFIKQLFVHLDARNWEPDVVSSYTRLISGLLTQSSENTAAGLSFQIADVFVPELLAVLSEGGRGIGEAPLLQMLDVFVEALATCSRGSLLPRIREGVFQALIRELEQPSQNEPLTALNVAAFSEAIFQRGAQPGVHAQAREILYELSAALEKSGGKKRKRGPPQAANGIMPPVVADGQAPDEEQAAPGEDAAERAGKSAKKAKRNGKKASADPGAKAMEHGPLLPAPKLRRVKTATPLAAGVASARSTPVSAGTPLEGNLARIATVLAEAAATSPRGTHSPTAAAGGSAAAVAKSRLGGVGLGGTPSPSESPKSQGKKGKKRASLATEAITRAAERALVAVEKQKKGQTTVHPPTPGSPSQANFDSLFQESLQEELRQGSSPRVAAAGPPSEASPRTPATSKRRGKGGAASSPRPASSADGTPGSSAKHVRFKLKNNLYFQKGGEVPSPELRTPDSCRPKGSALKKQSKFSRLGGRANGSLSPRGEGSPGRGKSSPRGGTTSKGTPGSRNRRKSNLGNPATQRVAMS